MTKSNTKNNFAARYDKHLAVIQLMDAKKPLLVRLRYSKDQYFGVIQNQFAFDQPDELPIHANEVLCVFPNDKPTFGKTYGVAIEPLISSKKLPKWGRIAIFRELTNTETKMLMLGLEYTRRKFIRKYKLNYLLPVNLEIRNPEGKTVGRYIRTKDGDPTIVLCPPSFVTDLKKKLILRIVAHECAHMLYDLFLDGKIKTLWIKAYKIVNKITQYNTTELQTQWKDFYNSNTVPSEYRKQLEDAERLFFDCTIKWIKDTHRLDIKNLDTLRENQDTLADYWPASKLHISELFVVLTKYANKSALEFFCEAMSLFAIGEKLPSDIKRLCEKTLKAVRPR